MFAIYFYNNMPNDYLYLILLDGFKISNLDTHNNTYSSYLNIIGFIYLEKIIKIVHASISTSANLQYFVVQSQNCFIKYNEYIYLWLIPPKNEQNSNLIFSMQYLRGFEWFWSYIQALLVPK